MNIDLTQVSARETAVIDRGGLRSNAGYMFTKVQGKTKATIHKPI